MGARVEVGDGRVIEKATVLIRDGLIEAVGTGLAVPPDAEVLKGDGLIVFPGFIDGFLNKGLKLPDAQPAQDVPPDSAAEASPSMREANRKGIRPEVRAASYFAMTEQELHPIRKAGFTTALIAPAGGMINGVAALVNLSGRPRRESVVQPEVAMAMSFKLPRGPGMSGGGGYPGTLLGLFAQLRQTLEDARHARALRAAFERGGSRRPPADDSLAALVSVLDRRLPALFEADSENEVYRALALMRDQNLQPIICGAAEAWKLAPAIVASKTPLILGLAFGREPKLPGAAPEKIPEKKPEAGEKVSDKPAARQGERKDEKKEVDDDEYQPLAERRERHRLWLERVNSARRLHEAGVSFAFTTRGTKSTDEFWTNLRRAVKEGLPRDTALRALTVNPARIFGVERQLGTVERGKIANLVVMSADFLDEKAKVKFVFIDGRKFDVERDPTPASGGGSAHGEEGRAR